MAGYPHFSLPQIDTTQLKPVVGTQHAMAFSARLVSALGSPTAVTPIPGFTQGVCSRTYQPIIREDATGLYTTMQNDPPSPGDLSRAVAKVKGRSVG